MKRVHYSKESQYFATARTSVFGWAQEYPDASRRLRSSKDLSIEDQHKERVERKINFHLRLTIARRRPSTESSIDALPNLACARVVTARLCGLHRVPRRCPMTASSESRRSPARWPPANAYNRMRQAPLRPKKPIPTQTKVDRRLAGFLFCGHSIRDFLTVPTVDACAA
jgi:hypothetical protein